MPLRIERKQIHEVVRTDVLPPGPLGHRWQRGEPIKGAGWRRPRLARERGDQQQRRDRQFDHSCGARCCRLGTLSFVDEITPHVAQSEQPEQGDGGQGESELGDVVIDPDDGTEKAATDHLVARQRRHDGQKDVP